MNLRYHVLIYNLKMIGKINFPGDKSLSHRAIILGALSNGITKINGLLEGDDNLVLLNVIKQLGILIEGPYNGKIIIHGKGLHGLKKPNNVLYLGNSGTAIRLLTGLLSGQRFDSELIGDYSLNKRPMFRIINPLRKMGANIKNSNKNYPPIKIKGNQNLIGINYKLPIASAQIKSCLLLAGIYAKGKTILIESEYTRNHTEIMMKKFGYNIEYKNNKVCLIVGNKIKHTNINIPSDISSSAFFIVAAIITPGSNIVFKNIGINYTRIGLINILKKMGAQIYLYNSCEFNGELVADIHIRYTSNFKGIDINKDQISLAIDEFPILFIAAANAKGITRIRGADELRFKESDRIQVMSEGLNKIGIKTTIYKDGIDIIGGTYHGGFIDSKGDHRIAMAFTIAAIKANSKITINNCMNVITSFPNFVEISNILGIKLITEN
ncbi:3-phosphoshikimate 1-carboxyvinyltransferase [Candidatus Johnevansia muelleri]|uniref:3-phosphoshikimate 1-carboxyvinyltransferase n=1 Tax=Candidatus Johnevansia muelleri TaxID=1495769 RepID=A0A078KBR8_9GAMM|nr:3-phosphoshikimate 1-carboxyvinyltransferase [Candidatus Evansia muelleri]